MNKTYKFFHNLCQFCRWVWGRQKKCGPLPRVDSYTHHPDPGFIPPPTLISEYAPGHRGHKYLLYCFRCVLWQTDFFGNWYDLKWSQINKTILLFAVLIPATSLCLYDYEGGTFSLLHIVFQTTGRCGGRILPTFYFH